MFAILVAALATAVPAKTPHDQWRACVDARTDNEAIGECGGRYIGDADAALNVAWRRTMAAVATLPATRAALLDEQRAWLAYREKTCSFYGLQGDWGREGRVIHQPECIARSIERTATLEGYLAFVGVK